MKVPMKKMVATVAMAGAITAGTAGVAVAQDVGCHSRPAGGNGQESPEDPPGGPPPRRQDRRRHSRREQAGSPRCPQERSERERQFAGRQGRRRLQRAGRTRPTPRSTRPSPTVGSTPRRARRSRARSRTGSTRPWTGTLGRAGRRRSGADAFRSEPGSPDVHRAPVSTNMPAGTPGGHVRVRALAAGC